MLHTHEKLPKLNWEFTTFDDITIKRSIRILCSELIAIILTTIPKLIHIEIVWLNSHPHHTWFGGALADEVVPRQGLIMNLTLPIQFVCTIYHLLQQHIMRLTTLHQNSRINKRHTIHIQGTVFLQLIKLTSLNGLLLIVFLHHT